MVRTVYSPEGLIDLLLPGCRVESKKIGLAREDWDLRLDAKNEVVFYRLGQEVERIPDQERLDCNFNRMGYRLRRAFCAGERVPLEIVLPHGICSDATEGDAVVFETNNEI